LGYDCGNDNPINQCSRVKEWIESIICGTKQTQMMRFCTSKVALNFLFAKGDITLCVVPWSHGVFSFISTCLLPVNLGAVISQRRARHVNDNYPPGIDARAAPV
jgi:hypothetical protein